MKRVLALFLALALVPAASLAEAPVYAAPAAAPAASTPLVWKDPDGTLHVGAWRSSDAEVKLAQRLMLAESQRDACQGALGDAQGKQALDCGEQAARTNYLWLWVTGGIVLGAVGGYFTSQALK